MRLVLLCAAPALRVHQRQRFWPRAGDEPRRQRALRLPRAAADRGLSGAAQASYHSLWDDSRANLFQDPRAAKVGDILTVKIRINDKATLDNSSSRERDSGNGPQRQATTARTQPNSGSRSRRTATAAWASAPNPPRAAPARSTAPEKIDVSVAAVVTEVLPNGNLLISGSQEVRVNFELRIVNVTGIVRPRDISTGNTIDYEKIAEARISYGGRGRISEVQQPRWGQQVIDAIAPY